MRHSRRAVMAERYKLYAKKNIFNSRYFVRNVQIGLAVIILMATVVGAIVLICSEADEEVVATNAKVSVKEALFSNSEERKSVQKEETSEQSTEVVQHEAMTEKIQKELENTITVVANNAEKAVEEKKQKEQPKSEFENKCIANVDETLNIRKEPSTEADFVGSMNPGAIAIVEGTEGEWTKIKSGDVEGYVLSEYILTGESAEQLAKDYVTLRGTVLEDGVNIRSEKSTDAEILTVLDKDDVITVLEKPTDEAAITEKEMTDDIVIDENANEMDVVTEEVTEDISTESVVAQKDTTETVVTEQSTTETVMTDNTTAENTTTEVVEAEAVEDIANGETEDDIQWIPVMLEDGQTGYISADLVEVDELYEIAVSAEELQRRAQEEAEEAARRAAEEEAARQAAAQAASQQTSTTSNNTSNTTSNSSDDAYQGATTKPVTATESGECIGTFTITAYCGCKKCSAGNSKTASGTTPTEGRTIAADTSILPFGTQVVIDGIVYTVEDCGSGVSGNHIDIFFATHDKAIAFGRKSIKVYKY